MAWPRQTHAQWDMGIIMDLMQQELKVLNIIPLANCKQNSCCINFSWPKIFPAAWQTLTSAMAKRHWNTQHGPCWVFDTSSKAIGWAHTSLIILYWSWMIGIINFQSEWLATYSKLPKWQVPLVGCCVILHWAVPILVHLVIPVGPHNDAV